MLQESKLGGLQEILKGVLRVGLRFVKWGVRIGREWLMAGGEFIAKVTRVKGEQS